MTMKKHLAIAILILAIATPTLADTIKANAKPSGTFVGIVSPIYNGRLDFIAVNTKNTKAFGIAIVDSSGGIVCLSVTGPERTAVCSFSGVAVETYAVIAVSLSGTVKIIVNVNGPSDEPFFRKSGTVPDGVAGRVLRALSR